MENTSQPVTLPSTFYLEFFSDGTLVDGWTYTNLDRVRDIAFDISEELGRKITIKRENLGKSFVEEVVG